LAPLYKESSATAPTARSAAAAAPAMTPDLLYGAGAVVVFIVALFFVLGCCDNVFSIVTCCQKRGRVADTLALSTLGADLCVAAAVLIAGGSVDYTAGQTARAGAGLGVGLLLSLVYVALVLRAVPTRVLWGAAALRAAAPVYTLVVLTEAEFESAAAVVAFGAVGIFAMLLEPCRAPAE